MNKDSLRETLKKEWQLPLVEKITKIVDHFSTTEKTVFFFFATIFVISGLSLLYQVNKIFLVEVPDYGGTITEGAVGSPRFINPVLAGSDIDRDLTSLIYSGLLRVNSKGEIESDLAESYNISPDALTYTIKLKDNIYFHDGTRVTADDVIFTIERAQDPQLKSPREANWIGVKVEKIDDQIIIFTLKQPYSPFIQNLTLGILPKHIWKTASVEEFPFSQFNTKPIGTGPYKIDYITYTGSGLPSEYHLKSFSDYSLGKPFITNIIIKSYQNEKEIIDAFKGGDIESLYGISPKQLPALKIKPENIMLAPLPRVFGVFFNQNTAPVLINKEVRLALDMATDKQAIIDSVLQGYGQVLDGPMSQGIIVPTQTTASSTENRIEQAKALLIKNGWKQNDSGIFEKTNNKTTTVLSFSISTGDAPELKETALMLQKQWTDLGAKVEIKIFEIGDLNQNIIKTRKYDSLLFGEVIGRDYDLYPFWHSSGRVSPGLNIALYANVKADKLLENIRKTTNPEEQKNHYDNFNKEIKNDIPAVFTYSPYFIYIIPKNVKNISLGTLTNPGERFSDVSRWYIETNNVWKIFNKNN